ncbi:hypothetical protein AC249_AIPGENE28964 [Exaiptasia diaphana]|nr:hypothetical protein AC249_AIPGENE28964 [Exaiptasia diaphana]
MEKIAISKRPAIIELVSSIMSLKPSLISIMSKNSNLLVSLATNFYHTKITRTHISNLYLAGYGLMKTNQLRNRRAEATPRRSSDVTPSQLRCRADAAPMLQRSSYWARHSLRDESND